MVCEQLRVVSHNGRIDLRDPVPISSFIPQVVRTYAREVTIRCFSCYFQTPIAVGEV